MKTFELPGQDAKQLLRKDFHVRRLQPCPWL